MPAAVDGHHNINQLIYVSACEHLLCCHIHYHNRNQLINYLEDAHCDFPQWAGSKDALTADSLQKQIVSILAWSEKKSQSCFIKCATGYFQPWSDMQETIIATLAISRHNSPLNCDVSSCTICAHLLQVTGLLWLQVSSRLWLSCSASNNDNYEKYSWHWFVCFFDEVWSWRYGKGKTTGFYFVYWTRQTVCTPNSPNSWNRWVAPALTQTAIDLLSCLFLAKIGHSNNSF